MAPFLPNFAADLAVHDEKTGYSILDGGVIPCSTKSTLPNAEKLILVQSSKEPSLDAAVCSVLGILDAAEIMKAQTVSIPPLSSFANDDELAMHTVYHTIEFLHTIKDNEALSKVRLVSANDAQMNKMAACMKQIIDTRKA